MLSSWLHNQVGGEGDEDFELKGLSLGSVQECCMANSTLPKDESNSANVA